MKHFFRQSIAAVLSLALVISSAVAAPVYSTALKNARMDAITTAIGTSGKLVIGTSALSGATGVLCTITLNSTAAASASGGILSFSGFPKTCTASDSGTAARAVIRTSGDVDVVTGLTVGTSASDFNLDSVSVTSSQTVTITGYTITHN